MTAPFPMTFPAGRVLPGWWRDLASFSPRRLWVAHLVLHGVEAQVEVVSSPLSRLAHALLEHLSSRTTPWALSEVLRELNLPAHLGRDLVMLLTRQGLLHTDDQDRIAPLTQAAMQSLQSLQPGPTRLERRLFYFADTRPPLYLPLTPQVAQPLPPPTGWRFDLAILETCVAQSPQWKRNHGFPQDVVRVHGRGEWSEQNWQSVPLDRPEQVLLTLVEIEQQLVGFPINSDSWTLIREPVLTLPLQPETLAPLLPDPRPEEWRQAWQAWCQQRSLTVNEVEACKLEPVHHRLVVKAPPRMIDRLRQAKSEVLRGEAWVMVGSGRVRVCAQLEMTS